MPDERIERAKKILARARRDLGKDLYGFSPVDLLLDNMPELKNSQEARELLNKIESYTPKEVAENMITDEDLLNEARAALVAEWLLKKWDGDISLVEEEVSDFDDRCLNVVFSRDGVVDKVLSEIGCKPGQVQTEDERIERERATLHPTVLSVLKKYGDDPRNLVKAYRVIGRVVDFMKRNYIDTANELKNVYAELGKEIKKMAVRGKVESE